jgi:hypothetical protein
MNIFDQVKQNPAYTPFRSSQWFLQNVRLIHQGMSTMTFLGDNLNIQASSFIPGQMIQFFYSAKHKKKLPHWDAFPLVLPFSMTGTHFTGLNLHYLHPRLRLLLLSKLYAHVSDDSFSPRAKMNISWKLLKNASSFPEVIPCVKQYILSNVKSRFLIINPIDWPIAAVLPSERFKGADPQRVYNLSSDMIGTQGMKKHGR